MLNCSVFPVLTLNGVRQSRSPCDLRPLDRSETPASPGATVQADQVTIRTTWPLQEASFGHLVWPFKQLACLCLEANQTVTPLASVRQELSFPKIISAHIDDAVRRSLGWQ